MRKGIWFAVVLCLGTQAYCAETPAAAEPTFADLVAAQKVLRAEIKAGKQTFAPENEKTLLKAQDHLFAIAEGNPTDADLDEAEWVEVFNAQAEINQIITASAADEREVCRREKPTGSNRTRSVCMTVAQWRERQTTQSDIARLSRDIASSSRVGPSGQ